MTWKRYIKIWKSEASAIWNQKNGTTVSSATQGTQLACLAWSGGLGQAELHDSRIPDVLLVRDDMCHIFGGPMESVIAVFPNVSNLKIPTGLTYSRDGCLNVTLLPEWNPRDWKYLQLYRCIQLTVNNYVVCFPLESMSDVFHVNVTLLESGCMLPFKNLEHPLSGLKDPIFDLPIGRAFPGFTTGLKSPCTWMYCSWMETILALFWAFFQPYSGRTQITEAGR